MFVLAGFMYSLIRVASMSVFNLFARSVCLSFSSCTMYIVQSLPLYAARSVRLSVCCY